MVYDVLYVSVSYFCIIFIQLLMKIDQLCLQIWDSFEQKKKISLPATHEGFGVPVTAREPQIADPWHRSSWL